MGLFPRKSGPRGHFEPLNKPQVRKLDFTFRALAFVIFELSFLALAYRCLRKPIPIYPPSSISVSEAKAITTAVAVVWHSLAAWLIKDIVSSIFSAECIAQYRRTGCLEPDDTDRVSRITSGLLVHMSYFFTKRPTLEYRLAFVLGLLVTSLGPLGPSVLTLNNIPMTRHQNLRIANLTMMKPFGLNSQQLCSKRAGMIVELEILEKQVYGYETDTERMLIPWPDPNSGISRGIIRYESDVVVYNYTCRWPKFLKPPVGHETKIQITFPGVADDATWIGWGQDEIPPDLCIVPLVNFQAGSSGSLGPSAFFFAAPTAEMDLRSINTSIPVHLSGYKRPTIVGALLCDPHFKIQRAQVTLSNGRLTAVILQDSPLVGNIPEHAANAIFSQGLVYALGPEKLTSPPINAVAMVTFLEPSKYNEHRPFQPLSLAQINENMNRILKSAAKAYISGYINYDANLTNPMPAALPDYVWLHQSASLQYQQISVVSSRPFFLALGVLDGIIVAILATLMMAVDTANMWLFSLETLKRVYHRE